MSPSSPGSGGTASSPPPRLLAVSSPAIVVPSANGPHIAGFASSNKLALISHDRTFWRESSVLRLTGAGARIADVDVHPAHLVLAEIRHTLAVVDLVEALLTNSPPGTMLRTERELRGQRRREMRDGRRIPGQGRLPDAVFIHPAGAEVALELDLTPKRSRHVERILAAYLSERHYRIVWCVLPRHEQRLWAIIREHRADDYVEVRAWYPRPTTQR